MQANDPEDGGIATLLDASRRETSIKKKKKKKKFVGLKPDLEEVRRNGGDISRTWSRK